MVRLTNEHLNDIYKKLSENYAQIGELRKHVLKNFEWKSLPQPVVKVVGAVDGSMMKSRICGGVLYAVSANALGGCVDRGMFVMSIAMDSGNLDNRLRRMMMTLEYRIGAIVGNKVDLVLLDGTLGGSLLPPTFSVSNPLNVHCEMAVTAGRLFIGSLDRFYEEVLETLEGNIYENILLSTKIFQNFDSKYSEYVVEVKEFLESNGLLTSDTVSDWEVFFEYVELLHAFNRLLNCNCAFISKTSYTTIIFDIIKEKIGEKGFSISSVFDTSLLNFLFCKSGYLTLDYDKHSRLHVNPICEAFQDELPNVRVIGVNSRKSVVRTYCRFINGGNLLVMETLKDGNMSLEDIISALIPYSKSGYPIYLKDVHHKAKISKKEFDSYVFTIMKTIVKKNKFFKLFFQNGRDVL
jgi:NurA-like 5'-3' nuclease